MFLELDNLTIRYGEHEAVKHFSFAMEEGMFCCLLGPSGCGKTTLLRCIGGFVRQSDGRVFLDGKELNTPPEERPIATVFQSYALFPHMTVAQNITYGLRLRRVPKVRRDEQLQQMLERMDLAGYGSKHVQELSGGEQQRVALARSLIVQPKLLLLDEPLSNLDAKLRIALRAELKRVQRDFGITTILVTHDQGEAFELGDRIVLMNEGHKVEEGTPEFLYDHPSDAFTRHFLGDSSLDPRKQERIRPEDWIVAGPGAGSLNATVTRKIFQGALIHYDCLTDSGDTVRCSVLNRGDAFLPREGERVSLKRPEEV